MKKSIFLFLFYCIVQGDGYFCKPVDFEIREYPVQNEKNDIAYHAPEKYQCRRVHDGWKCIHFDEGAILLEEPREAPKSNGWFVQGNGIVTQ